MVKNNIFMKVIALLVALITSYIVVFWEPKVDGEVNNSNQSLSENTLEKKQNDDIAGEELDSSIETTVIDKEKVDEEKISNEDLFKSEGAIVTIDLQLILEELTLEEKLKLNNILKKLSVTDSSKFISELSDKSLGVTKAFELLKRRVSLEDFKSVRELLEKYVDFSVIDI